MVRAHRGGLRSWTRAPVIPIEGDDFGGNAAAAGRESLLVLARQGGEIAEEFRAFCTKNLTQESFDFIVAAVQYEAMVEGDLDKQFQSFDHILRQFFLPTSPDEINVEFKMRRRITSFGTREAFGQLDDDARRFILQESLSEIVRMLEQNLWKKFTRYVSLREEQELVFGAGEMDREMIELIQASSGFSVFTQGATAQRRAFGKSCNK